MPLSLGLSSETTTKTSTCVHARESSSLAMHHRALRDRSNHRSSEECFLLPSPFEPLQTLPGVGGGRTDLDPFETYIATQQLRAITRNSLFVFFSIFFFFSSALKHIRTPGKVQRWSLDIAAASFNSVQDGVQQKTRRNKNQLAFG